jgi:hypothetical protein
MVRLAYEKASKRKLRLLSCACIRTVWNHLTDPRSRTGVEIAERFADGKASREEVRIAKEAASMAVYGKRTWAAWTVIAALREEVGDVCRCAHRTIRCALARDLFGPLFFRQVEIDSSWLFSNDEKISLLAEAIYQDRTFDLLPILADALEDAGCDNADILAHCRSGGEHVRGCWVVDLLLGKE